MSAATGRRSTSLLLWYGVLGGPIAFTLQHVTGFALTQAQCGAVTLHSGIHMDAWTLAVTATAVAAIAGAQLAAFVVWRRTRDAGEEPPGSRVHFMSIIGLSITPLFLAIVLMSGLGAVFLPDCVQG